MIPEMFQKHFSLPVPIVIPVCYKKKKPNIILRLHD